MHDPKFEKEVQQKMEELSFIPSEAVWENVEKEIRKDKKRRVPAFWFFLLGGAMLAGGYYTFIHENGHRQVTSSVPSPATSPVTAPVTSSGSRLQKSGSQLPSTPAGFAGKYNSAPGTNVSNAHANSQAKVPGAGYKAPDRIEGDPETSKNPSKDRSKEQQSPPDAQSSVKKDGPLVHADVHAVVHGDSASSLAKTTSAPIVIPPAAKESTNKHTPKHTPHWKIGLTAGTGVSAVDKSLFKASSVPGISAFASAFAAFPPGWQMQPSTIRQDFSFTAGVFAARPLSHKISVSVGLGYHYYSTAVQIGNALNVVPGRAPGPYNSSYSLYIPTAINANTQANLATPAVGKGQAGIYLEQYHLLELPVSVQWQFGHLGRLPVYWETGFSVSSLVSVNALYFDETSGTYYKSDNSLFRKTQMSVSTAFMLGIPVAGHSLLFGPQFQYGLTDLLKNNTGDAQRLFFAGIKLAFVLGK